MAVTGTDCLWVEEKEGVIPRLLAYASDWDGIIHWDEGTLEEDEMGVQDILSSVLGKLSFMSLWDI